MEAARETRSPRTVTSTAHSAVGPRLLPENIIAGAVKYTQMAKGTDHMIANDQILPKLCEELGWS